VSFCGLPLLLESTAVEQFEMASKRSAMSQRLGERSRPGLMM
jgi:hypothetical protein